MAVTHDNTARQQHNMTTTWQHHGSNPTWQQHKTWYKHYWAQTKAQSYFIVVMSSLLFYNVENNKNKEKPLNEWVCPYF